MGTAIFAKVRTARTSVEAGRVISRLREAGLHPVDLSMSAELSLLGAAVAFPIQVPIEEAEAAKEFLDACDSSNGASQ